MSGLEARLKEDLKARRLRFAYAAARVKQKEPAPAPALEKAVAPQWLSMEPFYPNMWFWDLVSWDSWAPPPPKKLTIKDIQVEVCKDFRVSLVDIKSPRRDAKVVLPRMIAMYLCRTLLEKSLPEIGMHFGWRDHSTVINAVRKIESLLERDPVLAEGMRKFMERFR